MAPLQEDASFPHLVYPSLRDSAIKDAYQWMAGKAMDDGAEGLWRVGDKLYDLQDFISKHPGGENWLTWTKGTDITEAFEIHHLSNSPAAILARFYVRDAKCRRNSPFTFNEDGFYKTLKSKVIEELKKIPKSHGSSSKRLLDSMLFCTFLFSVLATRADWGFARIGWVLLGGLSMAWTGVCAHNFFHQKDNWRMYMFNLTLMSSDEWRVTHILSHHIFPNTLMDFEISALEPYFHYLPRKDKTFFAKYVSKYAYTIFVYNTFVLFQGANRLFRVVSNKTQRKKENLIPFSIPLAMLLLSDAGLKEVVATWLAIVVFSSFVFACIGLNAAHHHPYIFHDGDAPPKDTDWGIFQVEAVIDRTNINGNQFLVMTNFGEHTLHHLFPSLDHEVLPHLTNVFHRTCEEFDTFHRLTTQGNLVLGQFQQLSRTHTKGPEERASYWRSLLTK